MGVLTGLLDRVRRPRFDVLLVVTWIVMFSIARAARFQERDPYWQVRAGMENLAGWPLARPDTWSWSAAGQIWYQNSPLWNTLLGAGYQAAGLWGLFAITLATMAGYCLLAAALARMLGARPLPGLAGLVLAFFAALAMLTPRATLAVQVLILAAVVTALSWARARAGRVSVLTNAAWALVAAGLLSVLGNWVHLSFLLIGPGLAVVWAAVWVFAPLDRARKLALTGAGAVGWLAGPFLSPYGLTLGLDRVQAVQEACQGVILEWASPFAAGMPAEFVGMAIVAALVAVAVAVWLGRRVWRGPRDLATGGLVALSLVGLPAALAGLTAVRFLGIGLLTLAPVMAVGATRLVDLIREHGARWSGSRWWDYTTGRFWRVVLWLVAVVLAVPALWLGGNHAAPAEQALVEALPSGCRLYSDAGFAGPVVLLRPDVTVWMDGRADFFGREQLLANDRYFRAQSETVVPPGSTCVAIDTSLGDLPIVGRLDASPEWKAAGQVSTFRLWLPAG